MIEAGLVAPDKVAACTSFAIDPLASHPTDDLDDVNAWSESDADEDVVTAPMLYFARSSSNAGRRLLLVSPSRRLPACPDAGAKVEVCLNAYMLLNHDAVVLFHGHMQISNRAPLKLYPVSSCFEIRMLLNACCYPFLSKSCPCDVDEP